MRNSRGGHTGLKLRTKLGTSKVRPEVLVAVRLTIEHDYYLGGLGIHFLMLSAGGKEPCFLMFSKRKSVICKKVNITVR